MIYIGVPFWHEDESIRNYRRRKAIEYSERLFYRGIPFYSPLLYSNHFKEKKAQEGYWINHGLKMVDVCDEMRILCLDGWNQSVGLRGEIARAKARGIPIEYIKKHIHLSFHGSRSLSLSQCKPIIEAMLQKHIPETIITHGEPEGACEWVRSLSKQHGISLKLHYLQHWRQAGQFHWRTKLVLEDSDHAIFLHDGISQGTANELALAKKTGMSFTYFILMDGKLIEQQHESQDTKDFQLDLLDDIFEKHIPAPTRISPEYQRWRKAVLKRDHSICVFCASIEQLCVHHIIPYSKQSSLALEVSNGQTLCDVCHRAVHGKPKRAKS